MKKYRLIPLLCLAALTVGGSAYDTKRDIRIEKTASEKEIRKINKQLRNRYKLDATVEVLSRDGENNITHLRFICRDKTGLLGAGGCESRDFGVLIIPAPADRGECRCKIADRGTEDIITTSR